jgi:hypothetical protein
MRMQEHERLAVLAESGVDCDDEIKAWLRSRVASRPSDDLSVHDIVSSVRAGRSRKFVDFVREHLGFEVFSEHGASVTTLVLVELCGLALRGQFPIAALARAVRHLDANFVGPGGPRPYPEGLDVLYNALDWCDDSWDFNNQPVLRAVLEEFMLAHSLPGAG